MFPFWEIGAGKMAETYKGGLVKNSRNFSRSAVSFRSRNSRISRFLELTSGGWDSWIITDPRIFGRSLVSFRPLFSEGL